MAASSEKFVYKKATDRIQSGGLRPALILLHGRGTDEQDLIGLAPSFDPRFLVYSLRAPFRYPFGGYMWFGADDLEHRDEDQLQNSLDLCLKFSDHIIHTDSVDPSKIFLFGFSLGAMTALELASRKEKLFAGVVAHSGFYVPHESSAANFRAADTGNFSCSWNLRSRHTGRSWKIDVYVFAKTQCSGYVSGISDRTYDQ